MRALIRLTVKNYRCFPDDHPLRIEIDKGFTSFVGSNNSGKSAILRLFWQYSPVLRFLSERVENYVPLLRRDTRQTFILDVLPGEELASKLNKRDVRLEFEWIANTSTHSGVKHRLTLVVARSQDAIGVELDLGGVPALGPYRVGDGLHLVAGEVVVDMTPFHRACTFLAESMYIGPFRNIVNAGGSDSYYGIPVGSNFVKRLHEMKAGSRTSENEAVYRLCRDVERIFGFDDFDINPAPNGSTLQVFIDGRSFRLSELGSGLAEFVLVLAVAAARRPPAVLIDEPEIHLHPTLQLDFLTTLASYTQESSVFFATHNVGLARASSDRIYACRRVGFGVSEVGNLEVSPHLGAFLGELGYSAYQDLGYSTVLLVEGPTEVKVMQQFLRRFKKDHEVVLLQMGGASLIRSDSAVELGEIRRICRKVACVIDSEKSHHGQQLDRSRSDFVRTCESLGIEVHVLERRATENYFTQSALDRAFGPGRTALGPYEPLAKGHSGWSKRENWTIAAEMSKGEIESTDLGSFLGGL